MFFRSFSKVEIWIGFPTRSSDMFSEIQYENTFHFIVRQDVDDRRCRCPCRCRGKYDYAQPTLVEREKKKVARRKHSHSLGSHLLVYNRETVIISVTFEIRKLNTSRVRIPSAVVLRTSRSRLKIYSMYVQVPSPRTPSSRNPVLVHCLFIRQVLLHRSVPNISKYPLP